MKKLLLTISLLLSLTPALMYAQTTNQTLPAFCTGGKCTYVPLEPLPGQQANNLTFANYVGNLFTISIVIGAMIAVGVLVFAGITYMVSEAFPQKDWGKRKIKQALWALLLLLGSYLILNTINPSLVTFNFTNQIGQGTVQPINPLTNNPFVQQSPSGQYGTAATSPAEQTMSAAQLNALPTCSAGQSSYNSNTLVCK